MNHLLDILTEGDICPLMFLVLVLLWIGQYVVGDDERLRAWGLRLAAVAFVAYGVYGFLSSKSPDAQDLLTLSIRGVLAAGIVLGLAWIILPILSFVCGHTLGAVWRGIRTRWHEARRASAERRARRQVEKERSRAREDYERQAPERERQKQQAEEQAGTEAEAQRRREDARANCELLYNLHAPEIGQRFSKQIFDEFVQRYLGDNHPPNYVEERARQLQTIISEHLEKVRPTPKFKTLEDIARWVEAQRTQIESMPDGNLKGSLIARLNARYADLTRKWMEAMQP